MNDKIGVLLVDDHTMLRKGMALLLGEEADIEVIGEAGDGEQAITQTRALKPDVVIMDINMPGMNGIEATRQIVAELPASKVVALSINAGKRFVDDMLSAGAVGYLLKESVPEELLLGIRAVIRGDMYLSSATTGTVVSAYVEGMSNELAEADIGILQTKLHRPAAPLELVPRPRLLERLTAERERPLVLVSAPAGYGKSVLISNWLESIDWPSTWLTLDQNDSDLRLFLNYFVAEVRCIFPNACEDIQNLIGGPQLPSLDVLAGNLGNELEAIEQPFILVLDDYHHIETTSPVNDLLNLLLERPPIPLHLVILSRRDPSLQLLKLRAHSQVTEVRMLDLSFTLPEVSTLLKTVTKFEATEEAVSNLHREMEGWIVGMQLAILTIRHTKDPNDFLINLHGGLQHTQEYLMHEVLSHQSPLVQEWLLKTAILDRFCAPLCDVVCATETGKETLEFDGVKFVRAVSDHNLFTISLDTKCEWFRYHHLFQHLLLSELEQRFSVGVVAGLHLSASRWFESRGLIEEAIQYVMKAKDVVRAADIIEQHQQIELNQNRWHIVGRWLAMLPQEAIQQRPKLLLAKIWEQYYSYQIQEISPLLEQVESLLVGETANESLLGEISFYRGFMLVIFQGDAEGAMIQFEVARKQLHTSQTRNIQSEIEVLDAIAHQMAGEGALSIQSLNKRIQAMGSCKGVVLSRMVAGIVFSHLLSGNLEAVIAEEQRFTRVSKKTGLVNTESTSRYLRANADLQSYHLDEALQGFLYAVEKRHILHRKISIDTQAGLILTYQAMQRSEDAANAMKQLMQFALYTDDPQLLLAAESCQARLSLLQGDVNSAIDWACSFNVEIHVPGALIWLETPAITQLRIMIATDSHENLQQASELLETLYQSVEAVRNVYQMINIQVLQCVALDKLGRVDEALQVLQQTIKLAKPGGWIYLFVELGKPMAELLSRLIEQKDSTDYLRRVLDHCLTSAAQQLGSNVVDKSQFITGSEAPMLEPLTKREFEILKLLVQRLQNKEIASLLHISPETIKTHLKHLFQKLQVKNRHEAAVKAVEIIAVKEK